MPITYRIYAERDLVHTTITGVLTDDQVLRHKRDLTADPLFRPGMMELSDVRAVDELRVTARGVQAMVTADRASAGRITGHRLAIVASDDESFGMARMYQMFSERETPEVGVFRTTEDAMAWLGIRDQEA